MPARSEGIEMVRDEVPRRVFELAAAAPHRLLMLDYDGTLAPFRAAREEAVPLPRSLPLLQAIGAAPATTVAIVSGRPIRELDVLLGPLAAVLVGEHGWEERVPGSALVRHPLPDGTGLALERAAGSAAARGLGERLERKRAALALHTRGLPSGEAAAIERAAADLWRDIAAASGLRVVAVDGGLELRVPERDKGTAVRDLLALSPPRTFPVYLGDDLTDEDAFRMVLERGFGIIVGPDVRPTFARGRLLSCDAVPRFLDQWLRRVEGRAPPEEVFP